MVNITRRRLLGTFLKAVYQKYIITNQQKSDIKFNKKQDKKDAGALEKNKLEWSIHMKQYLTSLTLKEMHIKTLRCQFSLIISANIKKSDNIQY